MLYILSLKTLIYHNGYYGLIVFSTETSIDYCEHRHLQQNLELLFDINVTSQFL